MILHDLIGHILVSFSRPCPPPPIITGFDFPHVADVAARRLGCLQDSPLLAPSVVSTHTGPVTRPLIRASIFSRVVLLLLL